MWVPRDIEIEQHPAKKIRVKELRDGKFRIRFTKQIGENKDELLAHYKKTRYNGLVQDYKPHTHSNDFTNTSTKTAAPSGKNWEPNGSQESVEFSNNISCDDYHNIFSRVVELKRIGFYVSYYVKAIQLEFELEDMKPVTSVHSEADFDPKSDPKIEYKELSLYDGEYIERVNLVKSSQTGYVRSIMVGTNYQRALFVEGEIEVHDLKRSESDNKIYFEDQNGFDGYFDSPPNRSPSVAHSESQMNKQKKKISFMEVGDPDGLRNLELRKASVIDNQDRHQNWCLRVIGHRMVGLKTSFADGYLEDIELYTVESEDEKYTMAEKSPSLTKYIFE